MKTYARIINGVVAEIFPPMTYAEDVFAPGVPAMEPSPANPNGTLEVPTVLIHAQGEDIPIEARYHPDFIAGLVLVPSGSAVLIGDSYNGSGFGPPPVPQAPATLTPSQALAQRDGLLESAALRIAPLQDAVDLDEATVAEAAALKSWKQYRVALNRIEQQATYPSAVSWPKAPA